MYIREVAAHVNDHRTVPRKHTRGADFRAAPLAQPQDQSMGNKQFQGDQQNIFLAADLQLFTAESFYSDEDHTHIAGFILIEHGIKRIYMKGTLKPNDTELTQE